MQLGVPAGPGVLALGAAPHTMACVATNGQARLVARPRSLEGGLDLLDETGAELLVCDADAAHPSSRLAERLAEARGMELTRVSQHHAQVAAVVAEHRSLRDSVLGLHWGAGHRDGDGARCGGEALVVHGKRSFAMAALRAMPDLEHPGLALVGDLGRVAPRRFPHLAEAELAALLGALPRAPRTPSMERFLVGVAHLLFGPVDAPLQRLEAAARRGSRAAYPFPARGPGFWEWDWSATVLALLADTDRGRSEDDMARGVLGALASGALAFAEEAGISTIALCGSCFASTLLVELTRRRLEARGFAVLVPRAVPIGAEGLALGQAFVALAAALDDLR